MKGGGGGGEGGWVHSRRHLLLNHSESRHTEDENAPENSSYHI